MTLAKRVTWGVMARLPFTAKRKLRRQLLETLRTNEKMLIACWPEGDFPPFPASLWNTYDPQLLVEWAEYVPQLFMVLQAWIATSDVTYAYAMAGELFDVEA